MNSRSAKLPLPKADAPRAPYQQARRPSKPLGRMGERGQVVIPKKIRDELGFSRDTEVEFEVKGREVVMRPVHDMDAYRRHAEKWKGALAEQFRKDGFGTTDEFMKLMRGR